MPSCRGPISARRLDEPDYRMALVAAPAGTARRRPWRRGPLAPARSCLALVRPFGCRTLTRSWPGLLTSISVDLAGRRRRRVRAARARRLTTRTTRRSLSPTSSRPSAPRVSSSSTTSTSPSPDAEDPHRVSRGPCRPTSGSCSGAAPIYRSRSARLRVHGGLLELRSDDLRFIGAANGRVRSRSTTCPSIRTRSAATP